MSENKWNVFQPPVLIVYHEGENAVLVTTYNMNAEKHYGNPKELKHENLPTLLFQLADRGYLIEPKKPLRGFKPVVWLGEQNWRRVERWVYTIRFDEPPSKAEQWKENVSSFTILSYDEIIEVKRGGIDGAI